MRRVPDVDKLANSLGLNEYQTAVLRENYHKYDVSGLVKRGGVLYAPRTTGYSGFRNAIYKILFGQSVDLIGRDKILLHAARHVKFMSGGYHCVRIGQYKYWADKDGNAVSAFVARRAIHNKSY